MTHDLLILPYQVATNQFSKPSEDFYKNLAIGQLNHLPGFDDLLSFVIYTL